MVYLPLDGATLGLDLLTKEKGGRGRLDSKLFRTSVINAFQGEALPVP